MRFPTVVAIRNAFARNRLEIWSATAALVLIAITARVLISSLSRHPERDAVRAYLSDPGVAGRFEELQWYDPVECKGLKLIRLRFTCETKVSPVEMNDYVFVIHDGEVSILTMEGASLRDCDWVESASG